MYYISNFCRVCLKNENSLLDIIKKEAESDPLINKLKLCVSEVEWSRNTSILMCSSCIERLNTAYDFKTQCLQSMKVFENYLNELNESEFNDKIESDVCVALSRKDVSQEQVDDYISCQNELGLFQKPTFLRVKANQQLYPQQVPNIILASKNNTNPFQNIYLNLIPSASINFQQITNNAKSPTNDSNVFLNINNALHKILPIVSPNNEVKPVISQVPLTPPEDVNISRLLTESKTEELSVEIDPTCFDCIQPEDENKNQSEVSDIKENWEDPILPKIKPQVQLNVKPIPSISIPALAKLADTIETFASLPPTLLPAPPNELKNDSSIKVDKTFVPPVISTSNFVPIRPKLFKKHDYLPPEMGEKVMDFFNVDHFMAGKHQIKSVVCELCGQMCDTIKSLHTHIRQSHSGEFPYRCKHCSSVYALQSQYETHMKKHDLQKLNAFSKDMITLEDLSVHNESILFPTPGTGDAINPDNLDLIDDEGEPNLNLEFKCEICPISFHNAHSLSRHKLKKHQQKRKYFVKGMKNAKCDICNREFSTQSYLQLHIKLHFRKNDYRLKVFNKDKYITEKPEDAEKKLEETEIPEVNPENNSNNSIEEVETKMEALETPSKILTEQNQETDDQSTQGQGLKIKINLRNLKNSTEDDVALDICVNEVKASDVIKEIPMEVDHNSENVSLAGNQPDNLVNTISRPEKEVLTDVNMDCDLKEPEATQPKMIMEPETVKDQIMPQMQRLPIKAELVNGKQQCTFCLKLYRRKHDLKRHLNNIHLKAIQYVCHLCNSPFYEAFQLTRHLRQHNGFVRCGTCLKEYSIIRDLKLHINAAHDNNAFCQCGNCGQSFQRIRYLREHMHEHDKSIIYKCHLCTEEFKESRDLSRHLVEHSGMYACNICHTTFSAEQELNNHSKCHSDDPANERKYKCELCPSKFKKKRYLMAHTRKTHSNKVEVLNSTVELDTKSA